MSKKTNVANVSQVSPKEVALARLDSALSDMAGSYAAGYSRRKDIAECLAIIGKKDDDFLRARAIVWHVAAMSKIDNRVYTVDEVTEMFHPDNVAKRPGCWKSVNNNFRQTIRRALRDAKLTDDSAHAGNQNAKRPSAAKDAAKDAPKVAPKVEGVDALYALMNTYAQTLRGALNARLAEVKGDAGMTARDAINEFYASNAKLQALLATK